MDKDIDQILDEARDNAQDDTPSKGEFECEVYWSTDGKHTVKITAVNEEGRKAGLTWGNNVYKRLVENYGTKQQLNMNTYDPKEDLGKCAKCGADNLRSKKGNVYCSAKCWMKNE